MHCASFASRVHRVSVRGARRRGKVDGPEELRRPSCAPLVAPPLALRSAPGWLQERVRVSWGGVPGPRPARAGVRPARGGKGGGEGIGLSRRLPCGPLLAPAFALRPAQAWLQKRVRLICGGFPDRLCARNGVRHAAGPAQNTQMKPLLVRSASARARTCCCEWGEVRMSLCRQADLWHSARRWAQEQAGDWGLSSLGTAEAAQRGRSPARCGVR